MANVLNRTTMEYLTSVHTPDYPESEWIINPDLSAVEGVPRKYWKIRNGRVEEMTDLQKAAVDAPRTDPDGELLRRVADGNGTAQDIQDAIPLLARRMLGVF